MHFRPEYKTWYGPFLLIWRLAWWIPFLIAMSLDFWCTWMIYGLDEAKDVWR